MIIAKFGGSSVKDAEAMRRCEKVVHKTSGLGIVILSATYNTTNLLEDVAASLMDQEKERARREWSQILDYHEGLARQLEVNGSFLEHTFNQLDQKFNELCLLPAVGYRERDEVLSFGEVLSSSIFSELLARSLKDQRKVVLVNAQSFLKTNSSYGLAKPDLDNIRLHAESLFRSGLENNTLFVTQGFIGSDDHGHTTTLGREGSDYSATLLAQALSASEVHIWTDVAGVYSADPHVVENARRIKFMTYDEATALATSGAKVLFPTTLKPLREKGIPLKVGSSLFPDAGETWIRAEGSGEEKVLGIAVKERSDGIIVTLVGPGIHELSIEQSEIDRGDEFRSFFVPGGDKEEVLNLWHSRHLSL